MAQKRTSSIQGKQITLAASNNPQNTLSYDQQVRTERPVGFIQQVQRLRKISNDSSFLSAYLPRKMSFYNYGFAPTLGPLAKGNDDDLEKWLTNPFEISAEYTNPATGETLQVELNMTVGEAIERFTKNAWMEYLLLDNAISLWTEDGRAPQCLPPEKCRYIDRLGLQILFYVHGLSSTDILLLDPAQQARFRQFPEIMINPQQGEHFKVMKRSLDGTGFATPRLFSILRLLGEIESKEIGYHGRSFQMRAATRQHKIGHAITNGNHAGKGTWFVTKKRSDETLAKFNNRQGPHDLVTNFDHDIEFPWPGVDVLDTAAWKGTDKRLCDWGGPIAQMLIAEKVSEGGLQFERTVADQDRRDMANFLLPAIKAAFKAPDNLDIRLVWSDLCFLDPAKASDLLKFSVQQGLVSNTTAQRVIGFDPEKEGKLKVAEAADKDAKTKFKPLWDMAHGIAPALGETSTPPATGGKGKGANPGKNNGRPKGAKTNSPGTGVAS